MNDSSSLVFGQRVFFVENEPLSNRAAEREKSERRRKERKKRKKRKSRLARYTKYARCSNIPYCLLKGGTRGHTQRREKLSYQIKNDLANIEVE